MASFSEMVNNQMIYQLNNHFIGTIKKTKDIERKVRLRVTYPIEIRDLECFHTEYEFWSQDEFSVFGDILDSFNEIDAKTIEYHISGTTAQIESYIRIIRRIKRIEKIEIEIKKKKLKSSSRKTTRILDNNLLSKIEKILPNQPWDTGIHKKIAAELELSNKIVSIAIKQLIGKGIFKPQVDGKIIEVNEKTEPNK